MTTSPSQPSIMTKDRSSSTLSIKKQTQLTTYFATTAPASKSTSESFEGALHSNLNPLAESLGSKLDSKPVYLTKDFNSWYILVERYMPTTSQRDFDAEWNLHPQNRRQLKLFGKTMNERRWSQAWGISMAYSGLEQEAKPIEDSTMVPTLLNEVNGLMKGMQLSTNGSLEESNGGTNEGPYNACLQNWYEPTDIIGLHSDDESYLIPSFPIFSFSWGGTRRFLFRSRSKNKDNLAKVELWLKDGDLLIMGGSCQDTHKHEVPKLRATMDPSTSNRINWTIRALR